MCCVSCIYRGPGCHDISRRQTRHIPHQPVKSGSIFRFPMFRNQNHGSLCPCRFYVIPLACLASRAAYSNKLDYVVYLAEASRSDQQTKQAAGSGHGDGCKCSHNHHDPYLALLLVPSTPWLACPLRHLQAIKSPIAHN